MERQLFHHFFLFWILFCIVFKIEWKNNNKNKIEESVSTLPLNYKSDTPKLLVLLSHNTSVKSWKRHLWNVPEKEWNPCGITVIYDPGGGDTWRGWQWMGGEEGGWGNGQQVRRREWGFNEWVDFHRRSGGPQGKLCFKIQLIVGTRTPLSCWSETYYLYYVTCANGPVPNPSTYLWCYQACLHSSIPPKPAWPQGNSATSWQSTYCGGCFKWTVKENQFGNCKHVSLSTGLWFRTRYESTIVKPRSLFSVLLPSSPCEAGIIPRRKHGHDVWFFPTCCVLYTHASELLSFTVI